MTHNLKTIPAAFQAVVEGIKTAEFRKNDRDYKVGDLLNLQEWEPRTKEYSGRSMVFEATHIVYGPRFGIPQGYCMISMKR